MTDHRRPIEHPRSSTNPGARYDRAAGTLLAHAAGDALGVPYEFAVPPTGEAQMLGGGLGNFAPGEWSDDTSMSACIAQTIAAGYDLLDDDGLDQVTDRFYAWFDSPPADIGIQTSAVLRLARSDRDARRAGRVPASVLTARAAQYAETNSHTAGNGALMRTEAVALRYLDSRDDAAAAARRVAELTHADPLAVASCVLATETIRVAVNTGRLDFYAGLDLLPADQRTYWTDVLDQAHTMPAATFNKNGFTVTAFQAAIAAIVSTPVPDLDPAAGTYPCQHLQHALHAAIRVGDDTDTVAAIAGAFLGALWGASAVPWQWRQAVHGWPGSRARDLDAWSVLAVNHGHVDSAGWPTGAHLNYGEPLTVAVQHPRDPHVWLGTSNCALPQDTEPLNAVVSLCRVGSDEPPHAGASPETKVAVRLADTEDPAANPNLEFVLADTAAAIAGLRAEGRTVLVHCVAAQQRTPSVAVAYSRLLGASSHEAETEIRAALHASIRGRGHVWDTALS